jgi:hypothetical protein
LDKGIGFSSNRQIVLHLIREKNNPFADEVYFIVDKGIGFSEMSKVVAPY